MGRKAQGKTMEEFNVENPDGRDYFVKVSDSVWASVTRYALENDMAVSDAFPAVVGNVAAGKLPDGTEPEDSDESDD